MSRDTVRNWVKFVLQAAGVNMDVFGVHSTRAASTSQAVLKGIPLATIIRTAGWKQDQTFRKFYQRPITRDTTFATSLLEDA